MWIIFIASLFLYCKSFPGYLIKRIRTKLNMINDNFPESFYKVWNINPTHKRPSRPSSPIPTYTLTQLHEYISKGYRVSDLDVRGNVTNTTISVDSNTIHPVVKALYDRAAQKSIPGNRTDHKKIAVAIEGGGMRGCVGAGMISALWYLGLDDTVDVIYGSSAGSLVGAYFIARQLPYHGPEVYYDILTSAGKEFIDSQAILRSIGLGLFDLRLSRLRELFKDRIGRPVLNLDYLLNYIVQQIRPLDWPLFEEKQKNQTQILKVITSGLLSKQSVALTYEHNNFKSLHELTDCFRASMLLPGVTGDITRLKGEQAEGSNVYKTWWREYTSRKRSQLIYGSEPMSDALIFEPVPYRSALKDNCTHILVLRTRPDNTSVTVKMGMAEKMIMSRFFGRKQGLPDLVLWMQNQYHKLVYAEDVLYLNEANRDYNDINEDKEETVSSSSSTTTTTTTNTTNTTKTCSYYLQGINSTQTKKSSLFCIALPPGTKEIKRMETSREAIFNTIRAGFATAYDSLVIDPNERGKGWERACEVWPDSILESPPKITSSSSTSFLLNMSNLNHGTRPGGEDAESLISSSDEFFSENDDFEDYSPISEVIMENALRDASSNQLEPGKRKALIRGLKKIQAIFTGRRSRSKD